jgi:hypothetical protein
MGADLSHVIKGAKGGGGQGSGIDPTTGLPWGEIPPSEILKEQELEQSSTSSKSVTKKLRKHAAMQQMPTSSPSNPNATVQISPTDMTKHVHQGEENKIKGKGGIGQ